MTGECTLDVELDILAWPEAHAFTLTAPGEAVFLDDHRPNVEAARTAGWNALHFVDAQQAEGALRERGWWPPRDR